MEHDTIECVLIIGHYFKNNKSLAAAVRKFHAKSGRISVLTSHAHFHLYGPPKLLLLVF